MKRFGIILLTAAAFLPAYALDPSVKEALIKQYDLNGNGKIDISERKPYVHALRKLLREERQRQIETDLKAPRINGCPQAGGTNHDGVIDPNGRPVFRLRR